MRASRRTATAVLLSGAVLVMACGEGPPVTASAPSLGIGNEVDTPTGFSSPAGKTSFVVHPGHATSQLIGDHRIKFEADAICDPDVSTYGPGEWDAPCAVVDRPVRITATWWTDSSGHPRVDFEPSLRFNPSAEVTLYLMDKAASADTGNATIFWIDPQGALVDESLTDPSVATRLGPNGFLYRRVKHFTGYVVLTGRGEAAGDADGSTIGGGEGSATGDGTIFY